MSADSRFHPEDVHQKKLMTVYLEVLNAQLEFRDEFSLLSQRIRGWLEDNPPLLTCQLPPIVRRVIVAFLAKWALPEKEWLIESIVDSVCWCPADELPTLVFLPTASFRVPDYRHIQPEPLPKFEYDPAFMTRADLHAQVKKILAEAKASTLDQAKRIEDHYRAQGFRPVPSRHRDRKGTVLPRLALRLYRRAVLHWPYPQIAEAERKETDRWVEHGEVEGTVTHWARQLEIPLP
jgi:hypothetical protein